MMSSDEMTALLAEVAKRDFAAFERLYEATSARLYGLVLRILRRHDLAADVLEAAYRKIWERAGSYDPAFGNPIAWMVAIARGLAIDVARRPGVASADAEPEIAETDSPGAIPRREMSDDLKRLLTCIGRLEPDRQRMLLLAYYGAFNRQELAEKLDTPVNLLKASLQRSLFEIDQCLTS